MVLSAEQGSPIMTKQRAAIIALATIVASIGVYSEVNKNKVASVAIVPAAAAPLPSTPDITSFNPLTYESSAPRVTKITNAMQNFGAAVLNAASTKNSPWAPFDEFCSNIQEKGTNEGGWVSQGVKPIAGGDCQIQHNPQYGGAKIQVAADVLIGPNGAYTYQVQEAYINDPTCTASVNYTAMDRVPEVSIGSGPDLRVVGLSTSLQEAKHIDNLAIICLDTTRP